MDQVIVCPKCGENIPITKALTDQIESTLRKTMELQLEHKEQEIADAYSQKLETEKQILEVEMKKKATETVSLELEDLRGQVKEKEEKIGEFRNNELDLLKRERQIKDRELEVEATIAKRVAEEETAIEQNIRQKIDEERYLKDVEKDKQLQDLRKQIDELNRQLTKGSQQTQGEAIELELECLLQISFPFDQIEPVGKGVRGADILQKVHNQMGHFCGTIIWESKNTKTWGNDWIVKLKDDQRNAKADIAVIASAVLPKDISHVGSTPENVWITDHFCVPGLAAALRLSLINVENARMASEGKSGKVEALYKFLSGNEFKQRVEGVVEAYQGMQKDLIAEKSATVKAWAKREKQIQRVLENITGMYGDIDGIIGTALPRIDVLELPDTAETTENVF